MTIERELRLDFPAIEIIENGDVEDRTLTWVVSVEQIKESPRDELVTWTITLPNMTPEQMRCLGNQFIVAADHAEDDRQKLRAGKKFTVELREGGPEPSSTTRIFG